MTNFNDWLRDSDKEIQSAVDAGLDKAFDDSNKRKTRLFPHYINFKILQEQKALTEGQKKLVYQTRVLTIATWVLAIVTAIVTIALATITWMKP